MTRRLIPALVAIVAITLVVAEVLLDPAPGDRRQLVLMAVIPAVVAAVATPMLSRWVASRASVTGIALAVGVGSLALGAVTASAASNAMFVSSHDYRLFLVVLLLASGISLAVAAQLTRPITRDVHRLGQVAGQVADGDLTVATGISRRDEVGSAAVAMDQMIVALRSSAAEREHGQRARQRLFTSLGHDLRTPLAAMQAAVEGLQDEIAPEPDRYLAVLAGQLQVIDTMLGQMIEFSRLDSGHTTPREPAVSLTELADETVEALGPLAGKRDVRLVVDADGPATVPGSPSELGRLIRNLTDNAVRHSPDGGTVAISLTRAGSDAITLSVHDDGPGFDPTFRAVAFEPFRRADPSRTARTGNSGLGLAISRAIAVGHDGTIHLGEGPGGHVVVTLPTGPPSSPTTVSGAAVPRDDRGVAP